MAEKVRRIDDYPPDTWREKQLKPRSKTWIKQVRDEYELYPSGDTIDEFADRVRAQIAEYKLEDAYLDMDTDYGAYGDRDRDVLQLRGWRDATEKEIAEAEEGVRKQREAREQWKAHEAARAKRFMEENPELFE